MSGMTISGIASGLDTEKIVKDLMSVERMKVDKLFQERQTIEWTKDRFREAINDVRAFRDDYFNILNPETNMMSSSTLGSMDTVSSDESVLTAEASADALVGSREVEIKQLASAARGTSAGNVTLLASSEDVTEEISVVAGKNEIGVHLNDRTETITVTEGTYTLGELKDELQAKIDAAFGAETITVTAADNRLELETVSGVDTLALSSETYGEDGDILTQVNIESGTSNRLLLFSSMEEISSSLREGPLSFDENGDFTLTINGSEIEINKNDTLNTALQKIDNSTAGVTLSYSSFSDTFTLESKTTGEGSIDFDAGGNFFNALKITSAGIEEGQNAIFTIDGSDEASRSSNTFTADGVTYTAQETGAATVTTSVDTEKIYSTVKSFVEDYNTLIEEINAKLGEERFRDYPPLTDEQKAELSEREIELWEEKAQSGLLRNEPTLERMLRNMRSAIYETVGDLHLSDIGIRTSSDYRDRGKLVLRGDGSELRSAIEENPSKVADIFTRRSQIDYSPDLTAEERSQRYEESGLAHRLSDIINDNIRTTRDDSGRKGILLERAGIEGDITQYNNYYDRQIREMDSRILRVEEMLQRREEQYYQQFISLERALQQLHAQGDWLMMQLGMDRQ